MGDTQDVGRGLSLVFLLRCPYGLSELIKKWKQSYEVLAD